MMPDWHWCGAEGLARARLGLRPRASSPPTRARFSNAPAGWTLVDAPLGHVALCPVACRDVGAWDDDSFSASIAFPCETH
jgi:hypothetical protein